MKDLVVLTVAAPLLMAFLFPSLSRISFTLARLIAPLLILSLVILVACIWFTESDIYVLHIGNFVAPQGIVFYVDRLALVFTFAVLFMALML